MAYTWPVTVAEAKAELNISSSTDDAELQGFIDAATAVVENIVGPVSSTTYTEVHDGGGPTICLRRVPVLSVTSITEYIGLSAYPLTSQPLGSTVDNFGYSLDDPTTGVITRRSSSGTVMPFLGGQQGVTVTYQAGRADVPGNIRLAALELIAHLWQSQRGETPPALAFATDVATGPAIPAGFAVPNRVIELLAPNNVVPGIA